MNRFFVGSGMALGFTLAAFMIVASGVLIHQNVQLIARNEQLVVHTHEVLHAFDEVSLALRQIESAQRGFLLTSDRNFLTTVQQGIPQVEAQLARIDELTVDNEAQRPRVEQLKTFVRERIASLQEGIGIAENNGREAARDFLLKGVGTVQMGRVRDTLEAMNVEENRLLTERAAESRLSYRSTSRTALYSAIVGLAMVLVAYFLSVREVASRKKMAEALEEEVHARTSELAQANVALTNSNRELEQFASVASHDLQEPLRKIEAFGDRLKIKRDALDDQSRDYLDRILNSAARMRTLINDLLSFSRVATRAQPFKRVELNTIANEVVGDLETRLQQTQGRVELPELPAIEADPTQIRQLFQNLIGNALKFHRDGVPPVVTVAAASIVKEGHEPQVELRFSDNGIGFEEQYLDRIFEVFQRLHGRNEYEGTGIGLAICRKIVERHRGTITARSTPGQGATFIVTLPTEQTKKDDSCQIENPLSS